VKHGLAFAFSLLLTAPACAETPTDLVKKLGDDSFDVRQAAVAKLRALGRDAEPAVRKGLADKDPAIRRECRRILPQLVGAGREARLKALLADKEGKQKHDLPGWPAFGKLAGTDDAGRQLFARVVRAEGDLLEAAQRDPKSAAEQLARRGAGLQLKLITPGNDAKALAEVVALAFVASRPTVKVSAATARQMYAALDTLANRAALLKQVQADAATRKLLLGFLRREGDSAERALRTALALGLKESAGWALGVARDAKAPVAARAAALVLLAEVGNRGMTARLEGLLNDKTAVGTKALGKKTLRTELRDVALAALVRLNGKKPADYGFPYLLAVPGLKTLPEPVCLGFASPADRESALKKWKK
jgi:hypothetical protein